MIRAWLLISLLVVTTQPVAYPLDGYDYTGIRRLEFYRLAQEGVIKGRQLPLGAKLKTIQVVPRWQQQDAVLSVPPVDPDKSRQIADLLGQDRNAYGVALLDLTVPGQLLYAAHNDQMQANVGSVGKLLVAVALFRQLAKIYPDSIENRERVLRETTVVADRFIEHDYHKIPLWSMERQRLSFRRLQIGDRGTLWEYLDWMLSASSNAAAAMVMKELLLLSYFGPEYPVTLERSEKFFRDQGYLLLGQLLETVMTGAVVDNGLDPGRLQQGSFFTREGKRRVGGTLSYATPEQLLSLLYRLERGMLVDPFSSREIKRLLYMTQKRIRYASHPALKDAAVYFKSGSLYRCQPEPGFKCGKYMGNKENRLASVAIIESPAEQPRYHYLVVVMSNVLRKNSAVAHQTLAMRIHRLIESWHRPPVTVESATPVSGISFSKGEGL